MRIPRWRTFLRGAIALATAGTAAHVAAATGWTLVDIGTLGGPGSYGAAVSDAGFVAGCSDVMPGGVHAFLYRDGAMRDLGTGDDAGGGNSCALAVNDAGLAAGRSGTGELVIWSGSGVEHLGIRGDVGGMNDAGTVVGGYGDGPSRRAFLFRDGAITDLGTLDADGAGTGSFATALNAKGEVVGASNGRAFLYRDGAMRDLGSLGGHGGIARGINDRGEVVGMSFDAHGRPAPFVYAGRLRPLPGGGYTAAIAINDRMQIVASGEGRHGYLVADGEVTPLDALPAVVAKGWHHLEPTGINDRGWIVGTAMNADGDSRAFLLIPGGTVATSSLRSVRCCAARSAGPAR